MFLLKEKIHYYIIIILNEKTPNLLVPTNTILTNDIDFVKINELEKN